MKIKRLFILVLPAALLLSACHAQSIAQPAGRAVAIAPEGAYHAEDGKAVAGSWQSALRSERTHSVSYNDVYSGISGRDYSDSADYTFREYIASTGGMKWAPHTWETSSDAYILEYTTTGFYRFAPNSKLDGWTIVDEMAVGAPQDVTADYVGRYGIRPGETARAWRIALEPNACWSDGTPIDADTYIYSYRELLDGRMMNRRADSLYAGDLAIAGAREYLYGQAQWDDVGIIKVGQYALVFITTAAVSDADFYVPYYLSDTYLVYEPLWESCKTCFDAEGNTVPADSGRVASVTTNYCTSLDTSISYGPYRLTHFQQDKAITLERNMLWYGYSDEKHHGQYQADRITCQVIPDSATALLAFRNGELDRISLSAADMDSYAASERIRYIPETYTTKLTFNTDRAALEARGTQILCSLDFRRGFSLAIDRTTFAAQYTSAGTPGYGLLNEQYVYDAYDGRRYRSSAPAKNALLQLYGLRFGENGDYATRTQAYAALTGYDMALARRYMQRAYDRAVAEGLYDGKSDIHLQLSVYQNEDIYTQMYQALNSALQSACRGTALDGKVYLEMVVDEDYYATMESGQTDIIFSTWGGSAYNPYSLLRNCYCDAGLEQYPNQMEYGFDSSRLSVQITLDAEPCTASLQQWARWCASETGISLHTDNGTPLPAFRQYDADTRCCIYADLEWAYLSQAVALPLYYRSSAELLSYKGNYPLDTPIDLAEFGGIAFYTFTYCDDQWSTVGSTMRY